MLTASPVIVQIIASDTPLAMLRASALPRSAIESNTSSMPLTVPISPSSGDMGTSTSSTGNPAVIELLRREIIAWRIWRAHQDVWSLRACHCSLISAAWRGRIRMKYQYRSRISVHIRTPHRKIQTTNGPPSFASSTMPRNSGICSNTPLFLDAFRQHAGALLVQYLDHRTRQSVQQGICEQERDRDAEAQHRGDHGLADTGGHQPRVAGARLGDALEGDDHADHGADQAEQRAGRDREAQEGLEALQLRHLAEHRLRDPELGDVRVLLDPVRVPAEREQHPPQRVVAARLVQVLELPAHLDAHQDQVNELPDESQRPGDADHDDDVADLLAEVDALGPGRALDVQGEQHAARVVHDRPRVPFRRLAEAPADRHELARELPRQDRELVELRQVAQELVVRHRGERTDADDLARHGLAGRLHHGRLVARN